MVGFDNPDLFIFDFTKAETGVLEVRYSLPFDATKLTEDERMRIFKDEPLEFSHSIEEQIGGQLEAGFLLTGLYDDEQSSLQGRYMPGYFATRAIKPMK